MNPSPSGVDHQMKKLAGENDPDFWPLSGKPYFYVDLSDVHLYKKYRMCIPRHLSVNLPAARISAKITYRGKVWSLPYLGNQGVSNCRLENQAWAKFAIENNLEVGNVCVFELTEGGPSSTSIKFKLQVFKDEFPTELSEKAKGCNANNPISID